MAKTVDGSPKIVWTAKIKVPGDGVESIYLDDAEVEKALGPTPAPVPALGAAQDSLTL